MVEPEFVDALPRWIMPRQGKIKINVHGCFLVNALPNGNVSGIGVVVRNSRGKILRMISGSLGIQSRRLNEFQAMLEGCKCAFLEGWERFILESDHFESFWEWRNSHLEGVHPDDQFIVQQLNQRKADASFDMDISLCDLEANALAEYLAEYGAHHFKVMVIMAHPFGRVFELWHLDMGLGQADPHFVAVHEAELEPAVEDDAEDQAPVVEDGALDAMDAIANVNGVEIIELE
ncbi:hypothetical protein ACET3Z_012160 [Daucus carota]